MNGPKSGGAFSMLQPQDNEDALLMPYLARIVADANWRGVARHVADEQDRGSTSMTETAVTDDAMPLGRLAPRDAEKEQLDAGSRLPEAEAGDDRLVGAVNQPRPESLAMLRRGEGGDVLPDCGKLSSRSFPSHNRCAEGETCPQIDRETYSIQLIPNSIAGPEHLDAADDLTASNHSLEARTLPGQKPGLDVSSPDRRDREIRQPSQSWVDRPRTTEPFRSSVVDQARGRHLTLHVLMAGQRESEQYGGVDAAHAGRTDARASGGFAASPFSPRPIGGDETPLAGRLLQAAPSGLGSVTAVPDHPDGAHVPRLVIGSIDVVLQYSQSALGQPSGAGVQSFAPSMTAAAERTDFRRQVDPGRRYIRRW